MDNIIEVTQNESLGKARPRGVFFIILVSLTVIAAAAGMKFFEKYDFLGNISFFGRYDGTDSSVGFRGLVLHMTDVLICATPSLIQILGIYLSSFSPFLIPVSILTAAVRGLTIGVAVTMVNGVPAIAQLSLYAAVTLAVCALAASFRYADRDTDKGMRTAVFKKTVLLFSISGICVLGETALSFIL